MTVFNNANLSKGNNHGNEGMSKLDKVGALAALAAFGVCVCVRM